MRQLRDTGTRRSWWPTGSLRSYLMSGEATATPATPAASADTTQEYAAFKLEQRGIDLIPDAERKMKPSGLFWLWSGAVFNVEFLFYGTLIMTFQLSVGQAIAAILIGNL